MASPYLREYLQSSEFLEAGTHAWYLSGVDLTQSVMFTSKWVYNKTVKGECSINGIRHNFIITDFPMPPTQEFWVVDQFNNIKFIEQTLGFLCDKLRYLLYERKICDIELEHTIQQYCKDEHLKVVLLNVIHSYRHYLECTLDENSGLWQCEKFVQDFGLNVQTHGKQVVNLLKEIQSAVEEVNMLGKTISNESAIDFLG